MEWPKLLNAVRLRDTQRQPEELRTEVERDYGRAVFSTPVRRLQDKAQVFPLEAIDAVRTRLTHSLEVSSVARGLARSTFAELSKPETGKVDAKFVYDIETIAATCGLIHDIGNPPFGHAGEQAIQDWFIRKMSEKWSFGTVDENGEQCRRDFEMFEGNAQTLRLLTKLQILSDRHGLNLTAATLSAVRKYTANSLEVNDNKETHSKNKLGYFASEADMIATVAELTGTGNARNPISFLVEASDDICYAVVDIEDGVKKGVLSWGDVRDVLAENRGIIGDQMFADTVEFAEKRIKQATALGSSQDEAISQYFRTLVIGKARDAVQRAFIKNYDAIMEGCYDKEILFDSDAKHLFEVLKGGIAQKFVYAAKETLRLEVLGRRVIQDLLDVFWEAEKSPKTKKFPHKIYNLLSHNYRTVFEDPNPHEKTLPVEYRRAMLITDYICGMTDSFALNLHRELFNG